MTERELRRLSRADLLTMMLTLSQENEQLRAELEQVKAQLSNRTIAIKESGSLAEAALKLNGIFEAAQAACDQYAENQKMIYAQMERETKQKCIRIYTEAKRQAEAYVKDAYERSRENQT